MTSLFLHCNEQQPALTAIKHAAIKTLIKSRSLTSMTLSPATRCASTQSVSVPGKYAEDALKPDEESY